MAASFTLSDSESETSEEQEVEQAPREQPPHRPQLTLAGLREPGQTQHHSHSTDYFIHTVRSVLGRLLGLNVIILFNVIMIIGEMENNVVVNHLSWLCVIYNRTYDSF